MKQNKAEGNKENGQYPAQCILTVIFSWLIFSQSSGWAEEEKMKEVSEEALGVQKEEWQKVKEYMEKVEPEEKKEEEEQPPPVMLDKNKVILGGTPPEGGPR